MPASLEVADIFHAAGPSYRDAHAGHLGLEQLKVMSAIEMCLRLRGPNGARDEFHLAATAQNFRKLAKLIPMPTPNPA